MCGIAGIYDQRGAPIDASIIRTMTSALVHRGPDAEGYHFNNGIGLGFRRLAVIDLKTGDQPMTNEDGTVACALNGEIYNFRELRSQLEAKGHKFTTKSDTEVLVHGYEEYGDEVVQLLRGMFALAVWDQKRRKLLLARDRVGIKPLYFWRDASRLIFASELRSIALTPNAPQEIDLGALDAFLTFRFVPAPQTIIKGISKLPAGHLLQADHNGISIKRYWAPKIVPDNIISTKEQLIQIRETLEEAVALHLVSDVPLGAFLSGGIDSSLVLALMSKSISQPIKSFTVGFPEDPLLDESPVARLVAQKIGAQHHELPMTSCSLPVDTLDKVVWAMDEPISDPATIPLYVLSAFARQHVTVALSGDGGDELFAGYDKHLLDSLLLWYRRFPRGLRETMGSLVSKTLGPFVPAKVITAIEQSKEPEIARQHANLPDTFTWNERQELYQPEVRSEVEAGLYEDPIAQIIMGHDASSPLDTTLMVDLNLVLPDLFLMKTDKMSMAHSLEVRVPLLDHRLVELAFTIPSPRKVSRFQTKVLLRRLLADTLPSDIVKRRKHYFNIPLEKWFKEDVGKYMHQNIQESELCRDLFQAENLSKLLSHGSTSQVFSIFVLSLWERLRK